MITQKLIDEIYRTYNRRPSSPECLNMKLLTDDMVAMHGIEIVDGHIVIDSMDSVSPFRRLPLNFVHGIENFEDEVAIVLHSSIVFLSKVSPTSRVHLKLNRQSLWRRLLHKLKILR